MDRRIEKSRQAIMEAFTKLMLEKDFEKITIHEIAELANVNRGTVYAHYADIFDLLDQCIENHLNKLFENCQPRENDTKISGKNSLCKTFKYLEQNAFFYSKMLMSKSIAVFRNRLHALMVKSIEEQIAISGIPKDVNKDIMVQYFASATIGVIEWWITNAMPYSAEYMAEQLLSLMERYQNLHKLDSKANYI
ncbi:TetR/AcrR family transcriptional regulator [Anaerosinus massiliensis]|uniref:TetR/AcrR family transcriptional regulator n=1 Tax=Massilibacillus massiliensis TaxID=1806837 RepID=UPI000DA62B34|nr:TetR/AcrR family transcriptional regulator [Massilibacillus massiliensis]